MTPPSLQQPETPAIPPPELAGQYRSIVIDPPWDQRKTGIRSARPNQGRNLDYPTMTPGEIAAINIPALAAPDAFLWLWATNSRSHSDGRPILRIAFELMENWGFRYYTLITWNKSTRPCPFGPYQITTEHCLFGYRGRFETPRSSLGKMKTLFSQAPARHSQKPTTLYEQVRQHFPPPRLDVFARHRHPGFDAWGNQADQDPQPEQSTLFMAPTG